MKLISLILLVIVMFLLGLLFVRGRQGGLSVYMIPLFIISGLLFILIGKIAVFLALFAVGMLLLALRIKI